MVDKRSFANAVFAGIQLADDQIEALGLPSIPAAVRNKGCTSDLAGTGYMTAKYGAGFVELTYHSLVLAVTDDGSTGHASQKLLDVPSSILRFQGVAPNVTGAVTASWAPTTPVMSIGSAASGTNATLTTTEADIVQSTALTISSDAFTFKPDNTGTLTSVTDSTGGTASAGVTLAAVGTLSTSGGNTYADSAVNTILSAIRNNQATTAAVLNQYITGNVGTYILNASATAQAVYQNFACNSDPSTGKTITLTGSIRFPYVNLGDN